MARILIAEDEEPVRTLIARALAEDGHLVVATADGAEALDVLQRENGGFDLLLADIKMPVMDGIALALAVARDFPKLPILLMTGYADQRERASGLEALICDVIAKPFALAEIKFAMASAVAKGRRSRCTELIHDLALSIVMAWLLGVAANLIRQPLILAYLVAGFLLGPSGLKWVQSEQSINTIAELGLIFMLFMIGLEIDLKKIVRAGNVILVTSAAQILGCFVLALGLFLAHRHPARRPPLRRALSRRRGGAVEHRHHRQGALRQARARHASRAHHARRAGAAGSVRDPVPGDPAEPERSAVRCGADIGAACRRAARERAAVQPLRASAPVPA